MKKPNEEEFDLEKFIKNIQEGRYEILIGRPEDYTPEEIDAIIDESDKEREKGSESDDEKR